MTSAVCICPPYAVDEDPTFFSASDARAAASRATGTRNGEQET